MNKLLLITTLTLLLLSWLITTAGAKNKDQVLPSSRAALIQQLSGSVQGNFPGSSSRIKSNDDGFVRHMGTDHGNSFSTKGIKNPDTRAQAFLKQWANLFHGKSTRSGYKTLKIKDKKDRFYVRLDQLYADLPVFAAQTIVQLDAAMNVTYVNSDIMRDFTPIEGGKVSLRPTLSSGAAQTLAIEQVVAASHQGTATEAELMIYCPAVVGTGGSTQLVWQTIVEGITGSFLKEMVLINAHTGTVAFRYSLIYDLKYREVYDSANTENNPGTLDREEGDFASLITDVNQCYDYFGDTYDFYWVEHGRDSIDNAGMTFSGTVRYCHPDFGCPMANAFWYGSRMYFGEGFAAADDVVAHELTHGVTQYESSLIYSYQSGAINESLSDIWGEFVDLTNSAGTDTPEVRWLQGEDISSLGALRDMKDPPSFGDPDRILSSLYFCDDDDVSTRSDDYGGVHTNSGVNNKLAYLLTDGDSFNGQTITAMGISKVADLYYECQTNLLTSSSDYSDLYSALTQAAINLGFSQAERENVERACLAVELDEKVCFIAPPFNDVCENSIIVEADAPYMGSTPGATGSDLSSCSYLDILDVWHNYTPSFSGEVTIHTEGSDFNTTLSVFDACGGTELACNDDSGSDVTSRIVISMTAGQTYQIRVAGYDGKKGNYVLNVSIAGTDTDSDGVFDSVDNCPTICNSVQHDADVDNIGDVCDPTPGCGGCGGSVCEVSCDIDNDGILNTEDNCPDVSNLDQEDVDSNNAGDVCDSSTVYGRISGVVQNGVNVELIKTSCGDNVSVNMITTNLSGYYAFGGVDNGTYSVVPDMNDHSFVPEFVDVEIPQVSPQSYDFTVNLSSSRFVDYGDGTVMDKLTNLIWLKNANCYDADKDWDYAMASSSGLNSGECGLTDGSVEGDWRLATIDELQGIATDPPTSWGAGDPGVIFTVPFAFFTDIGFAYWSGTESGALQAFAMMMIPPANLPVSAGNTVISDKAESSIGSVWPVREMGAGLSN